MKQVNRRSSFIKWIILVALPSAIALQFITSCDSATTSTTTYVLPARYFKDSVQAVFTNRGCIYCHSSDGSGYYATGGDDSGGLNLETAAYASLVNKNAYEYQFSPSSIPRLRVKAGSPDSSYLYHKVTKNPPEYGGRMPLGDPDGLTASEIAVIKKWIQYGAPLGDTTTH